MLMFELWCRALSNGHKVYNPAVQLADSRYLSGTWPKGLSPPWKPLLPWQCKPFVPFVTFAVVHVIVLITHWDQWSWGLPAGIFSSFAVMHSGIWGTPTPLRLSKVKITDLDQLPYLVAAIVFITWQYGRNLEWVRRLSAKLLHGCRVLFGTPYGDHV
jgi:hypothetical protein